MAEWTITPTDGVEDKGNGQYVFSANNTYCDSEYTVSYTDSGCTCSATVIVQGLDCSDTKDEPIWKDYSCEGHEDSWVTVNGTQTIHPRHLEGCTKCVDGESYTIDVEKEEYCKPACCNGFSVGKIDYCRDGTGGNLGNCGTLNCSSSDCCKNITDMSATSSADWLSDPVYQQDAEGDWHFRAVCEPMEAGKGHRECTCTATFYCGQQSTSVSWTVKQWDVPCD